MAGEGSVKSCYLGEEGMISITGERLGLPSTGLQFGGEGEALNRQS